MNEIRSCNINIADGFRLGEPIAKPCYSRFAMARTSLSRYTMLVWLPGYLVVSIDLDRERRIRNWLLQQPLLISVNGLTYQHRLSLACPNPTLRLLEHDVKCHFRKNPCYLNRVYLRIFNDIHQMCKNRILTNFSLKQ